MASDHRLLGAALNVADLRRSTDFYTHVFGMKEINRYETGEMTEVFMKWREDDETALVLVVHGGGEAPSEDRRGYGRTIIQVPDAAAAVARIREAGGTAGDAQDVLVESLGVNMVIALAHDPDGYMLELVQDKNA